MKKMVAFFIVAAAATALYAQNTVSSANIVGYVRHELPPGGKILIGVNFTADGKSPTLKQLLGTKQLRAAASPSEADQVLIWNPETSGYKAYALHSKDREFRPCDTWLISPPVNPVVPAGSGFWVVSASGSTATNCIFISGDVTDGPPADFDLQADYHLVANPFPAEATIAALTAHFDPQPGDRTAVWSRGFYTNYRFSGDGKWISEAAAGTDCIIKPGEAFWFIRKRSSI